VDLMDMFLMDDRLMDFVNHWLMVLVDHWFMHLSDQVLVMLMDNIHSLSLDNGLSSMCLDNGLILMSDHLRRGVDSSDFRSFSVGLDNSLSCRHGTHLLGESGRHGTHEFSLSGLHGTHMLDVLHVSGFATSAHFHFQVALLAEVAG